MGLRQWLARQTPLTISLLSFLLMLAIVMVIGLAGGNHIIRFLQQELLDHGLHHNEEVLDTLAPMVTQALADGHPRDDLLRQFQLFSETAGVFGARLFLFDRDRRRVLADSRAPRPLPYPVAVLFDGPLQAADGRLVDDPVAWQGAGWRRRGDGTVALISIRRLNMGDPPWSLGVSSDPGTLMAMMNQLHLHLDLVLLVTYGLIGILGFLVLRWVGRRYEQGLEAQVAARTRELEAAHQKLLDQERLATIGRTAAVMAHEMRNPLASIKLVLSGLGRDAGLDERQRRRLALVDGEVDRLEALLSDILDYARPVKAGDQPVHLDELLDQVLELEAPLLEARGLRVVRNRCERCPQLRLDRDKMRQALLNLVKNAREGAPEGSELRIELSQMPSGQRLLIVNQGGPLPEEVLAHAFDFFFTTRAKGTGLGLGLVKRVVEAHGGRVTLSSRGSEVVARVELPES